MDEFKENTTRLNLTLPKIINESKEAELEFSQGNAVINFGITPLSTYNLMNCISICGSFTTGTFLTHESPTDYIQLQKKIKKIYSILEMEHILFVVLYYSDNPAKDTYSHLGRMTTTDIVENMRVFCENTFTNTKVITKTYSNSSQSEFFITGKFFTGKATISPTDFSSSLTLFIENPRETHSDTFIVNVLYNRYNQKIYKCPECKNVTGTGAPKNPTDLNFFSHTYNCSNKKKFPKESLKNIEKFE